MRGDWELVDNKTKLEFILEGVVDMIIDCDTHISPIAEDGIGVSGKELVARMDRSGIDKALSWPFYPYQRERLPEYCEYVYKSAKAFPDRLLGFGWIDPMLGIDHAVNLTKKCMEEFGLYGVKLHGSRNPYRYDDLKLLTPIVDVIAKAGGMVTMHCSDDAPSRVHPYFAKTLAEYYPETIFMMIHMGGDELCDCAFEVAEQLPNVYLVGSHLSAPSIVKGINKIGPDKICFGSDTPFNLTHVEVASYNALLSDFSPQIQEKVMGGNIARVLKLN